MIFCDLGWMCAAREQWLKDLSRVCALYLGVCSYGSNRVQTLHNCPNGRILILQRIGLSYRYCS